MFRSTMRVLLAPLTIAFFDFLVLLPLALAIFEVITTLSHDRDYHEAMEVVTGIGVILIGWGVALEERHDLREIFATHHHDDDEELQIRIDNTCKSTGIGALIFGLFAEMCIESIKLPNHILNTTGINEYLVGLSCVFLALTAYILVRHIVLLIPCALGKVASSSP